jgi:hypothetical protein
MDFKRIVIKPSRLRSLRARLMAGVAITGFILSSILGGSFTWKFVVKEGEHLSNANVSIIHQPEWTNRSPNDLLPPGYVWAVQIILTYPTSSWMAPNDWNNANNTMDAIGASGGGGNITVCPPPPCPPSCPGGGGG